MGRCALGIDATTAAALTTICAALAVRVRHTSTSTKTCVTVTRGIAVATIVIAVVRMCDSVPRHSTPELY